MSHLSDTLAANEKLPHRQHQLEGVDQLVKLTDPTRTAEHAGVTYARTIPGVFAILDEVGCGKTKQVIDASQYLWLKKELDLVLVISPGFARSTWADEDPTLGEVALHAWDIVPNVVHEYHGHYTDLELGASGQQLDWVVTNFEFIRREPRLLDLIDQLKGRRTWLVVDESWCVKNKSDQTRAVLKLRRKRADRATILNGTPLADGKPQDLFYQFAILDPEIIGCKSMTHFKSKYCVVGGFKGKQVVGYQNLPELNARIAPYVLSRRTRDCFDLPPMLPPITIEARLSDPTWKIYRECRDEMVVWLNGQVSVSKQAIVKILRLSQICSGYLGGLEDIDADDAAPSANDALGIQPTNVPMPAWLRKAGGLPFEDTEIHTQAPAQSGTSLGGLHVGAAPVGGRPAITPGVTRELSREKLDAFLHWLDTLAVQPKKLVTWCRFRPELERTTRELRSIYSTVLNLKGGQSKDDRREVKMLLAPSNQQGRGAVVGITGTGAASLNFSAANIMVFMSHDPALIKRTQSIGRIERPGQTQPMLLVDVVATGPKGQKTIDHRTIKALRNKEDMAQWTVAQWRKILQDE